MVRSAIWLALAALIVSTAFHAFTTKASACTCPPSTPELELERADAVFLGELVSIRHIGQFPRDSDDLFTQLLDVLEFKATEIWKGHSYETIYVHTYPKTWDENVTPGGCAGGYRFWGGEGERFVVFVSDGSVSISYCGRSTHESKALNYFAVYGKGMPSEPGSVGPMPPLPPDVFSHPAENSTESGSAEPMPSPPPPDISAPPAENSPPSAGRCGLPLHFVSNYGDTAALIMIVGLPGFARLISRRRTRKSSRDA